MNQRQVNIIDLLSKEKKVEVKQLAHLENVSEVTIRKDLEALENNGFLKREHGYAVVNVADDINNRLAYNYKEKLEIAKKAASVVEPNETVIIESGSTCTLLALEIAKLNQNNTIITNSTFIARYLKDYPSTKVIVLSGQFQSQSEALVGPLIKDSIKNFYTDKIFMGADGIDEKFGISGSDFDRTEAVKAMAEHASNVYILSQSHKIDRRSNYLMFALDYVDYLVTDQLIDQHDKEILHQYDVTVIN